MIRWLHWNVLCLRGRNCARLIACDHDLEPGTVATLEYACGVCSTIYRDQFLCGAAGSSVSLGRERIVRRSSDRTWHEAHIV